MGTRRFFAGVSRLTRTFHWSTVVNGLGLAKTETFPSTTRKLKAVILDSTRYNARLPRRRVIVARLAAGAAATATATAFAVTTPTESGPQSKEDREVKNEETEETGAHESQARLIRLAEVKLHDRESDNPWVTRGDSVYDITEWVGAHPGGEVILRAAGGSIDPYWDIFTIHKRKDVYDILEQYFIGKVDPRDLVDGKMPTEAVEDPFVNDPPRDPRLRTLTARPCNAETPGAGLADFLTPNDMFYVRNHMWVPVVNEPEHHLTIELGDGEERTYSIEELKKRFKTYKVTVTLQCSGNRRKDMTDHAKQTNGLQWTVGAISSAEWEGVRLLDVLADAGLDTSSPPDDARHAQFMGLEAYGASIPMDKALDPRGDVLLVFKMNGQALPRDHGFPLRVIVPGNVAARSVKWLRKIVISEEESPSQWQRRDYKCFGPNVRDPDWEQGTSIQEMPITSAITGISLSQVVPPHDSVNAASEMPKESNHAQHFPCPPQLSVEGYAYSGGGRQIIRVDVSTDGGQTWAQAELLDDACRGSKAWSWKRWQYRVSIPPLERGEKEIDPRSRDDGKSPGDTKNKKITVVAKATDEAYNTQPENYAGIYNQRGNLATAWHRVEFDTLVAGEEKKEVKQQHDEVKKINQCETK